MSDPNKNVPSNAPDIDATDNPDYELDQSKPDNNLSSNAPNVTRDDDGADDKFHPEMTDGQIKGFSKKEEVASNAPNITDEYDPD